jgi:hypothetical protein
VLKNKTAEFVERLAEEASANTTLALRTQAVATANAAFADASATLEAKQQEIISKQNALNAKSAELRAGCRPIFQFLCNIAAATVRALSSTLNILIAALELVELAVETARKVVDAAIAFLFEARQLALQVTFPDPQTFFLTFFRTSPFTSSSSSFSSSFFPPPSKRRR